MEAFVKKVDAHWEYIKEAVRDGRKDDEFVHLSIMDYLAIIGYHYRTAMIHGYKHGLQDSEVNKP